MLELKKISPDYIPRALEKAEKYRLMNHPKTAESICRDVLAVDPKNQSAITLMVVALTEQFENSRKYNVKLKGVQKLLPEIHDEYTRTYLSGLVLERWARARSDELPGVDLYEYLREAMDLYEKAEPLRPEGDESCLLHYNFCVRFIDHHAHIRPRGESPGAIHHSYGDGFVH